MYKRGKLIAAALMMGGTMAVLSACGGSAATGAKSSTANLSIWTYGQGYNGWSKFWARVNRDFEKTHPGIKVHMEDFGLTQLATKFNTSVASHSGPDIMTAYSDPDYKLGSLGLATLDSRLTPSQRHDLSLIDLYRSPIDGHLRTLPWGVYEGAFVINKALLKKAGIPGTPPPSFQALLGDCRKLRAASIDPIAFGFKDPYSAIRIIGLIGGQLYNYNEMRQWYAAKIPVTDARNRQSFVLFGQMVGAGCFGDQSWTKVSTDEEQKFDAGKAAMTFILSNYIQKWQKELGKNNVDVWGMPPVPGSVYGQRATIDAEMNNGFEVMCSSPHKSAAWQWISYVESPAVQTEAWNAGDVEGISGQLPNNQQALANLPAKEPVVRHYIALAAHPDIHPGTWPPFLTSVETDTYNRLAPEWMAGRISLNSLISQIQTARNQVIASEPSNHYACK